MNNYFGIEKKLIYKDLSFKYYIKGDINNAAIFMLHAAFADHNLFRPQFEILSKKYCCITMDLVGHGYNYQRKSMVTMKDMPAILSKIMQDLGIKNAHFMGVSMGSLIAQGMAYFYPESVKSVTVVGGYSIHKGNRAILKAQNKEMFT